MLRPPLEPQGTTQAPAPAPPPIPALPSAPGAPTGGTRIIVRELPAPAIAGQAGQAAQDAAQAARDQAQAVIDQLQAELDQARAGQAGAQIPVDPQLIIRESIPIVGMSLAMVVAIFVGWPLARAFGRRLDRRTELGTVKASDLQPQLRQLQESIDTMAVELERISEAQRFQAKLMAERAQALPAGEKAR